MSNAEMATETSSSSTVDSVDKIEAIKKAADLLAQGKRNMLCGEVPKAVNLFEEAVQLLVKECGELSRDCADAYFSCGSALLELGRMETNVLGTALEGVEVEEEKEEEENEQFEKPPADDDSVRQQLRDEVYEAMAEGEREKELSKTEGDKDVKPAEDSEAKTSTEGEKKCAEIDANASTEKSEPEQVTVTAAGDADKEVISKKDGEVEAESEVKEKSVDDSTVNTEKVEAQPTGDIVSEIKDGSGDSAPADKKEVETKEDVKKDEEMEVTEKEAEKIESQENSSEPEKAVVDSVQPLATEKESVATENATNDDTSEEKKDIEMADKSEADKEEEEGEETVEDDEETPEGDAATEEEKEEDVPNFQLAWEYLDLAKVIYLKSESKEDQLKAAECHIKLGEVSMETEQHATAVEDLLSALKIQKQYLEPEDRLIAETHYQLGLAYGLGKEFKLSIEQYQLAISVIEAKIASLKKVLEEQQIDSENKENQETNPDLKKYTDEIKELQDLIPEMKNKIEDTQVEENDLQKMKALVMEDLCQSGTTKGFGSPTKKKDVTVVSAGDVDENGEKKASDIAHLVRKKRKPEEDAAASDQEVKKIRQEDTDVPTKVNGDAEHKVNGDAEHKVNGDSKVASNGEKNSIEENEVKLNGNGETAPEKMTCGDKTETAAVPEPEPMAT